MPVLRFPDDGDADSFRLVIPMQGCSLAQAEGEWVVCRVFQRSSNSNRPRRRATPAGSHAAAASPSSSSTASCVTDGSDQEEVSS